MSKIFISHSSIDKEFARELSKNLIELGHEIWLDEWKIKVGESIIEEVQKGLEDSDIMVVVLSQSSVQSSWVEREWKAKFWQEMESKKTIILPVLIEDCVIPTLLKDKKYADFRNSKTKALFDLVSSLPSVSSRRVDSKVKIEEIVKVNNFSVMDIIKKLSDPDTRLSSILPDVLEFANKENDEFLKKILKYEMVGWEKEKSNKEEYSYRTVQAYATFGSINTYSWEWNGDLSNAMKFLRDNKDVTAFMLFLNYPVSFFEQESTKFNNRSIAHLTMKGAEFGSTDAADKNVNIYLPWDYSLVILRNIRQHLIELLLKYV